MTNVERNQMYKVNCPNYLTDVALLFNIISFINLKSASNLNGNLNCSKELEHYAS